MALGNPYEMDSQDPQTFSQGQNPVQPTSAPQQQDPNQMMQKFLQMQHMFGSGGGMGGGMPSGGGMAGGLGSGLQGGMNTAFNMMQMKKLLGSMSPAGGTDAGFVDAPAMVP